MYVPSRDRRYYMYFVQLLVALFISMNTAVSRKKPKGHELYAVLNYYRPQMTLDNVYNSAYFMHHCFILQFKKTLYLLIRLLLKLIVQQMMKIFITHSNVGMQHINIFFQGKLPAGKKIWLVQP